ncbi:MAG: radical SAM protein [Bacillota bacterium]|nr:radical SAM protein [Bacillota bacterium]
MEKWMSALADCQVCPRGCGADRTKGETGFCGAPELPKLALVSRHDWEEPPISGTKGSGTVFFSHCNLGCVFCQNFPISQEGFGQEVSIARLTEIFLEQQERGFHNVNLVSAAQFIPQTAKALEQAKEKGLSIPIVYNSNGYESIAGLRLLDGLVDVYLPDFKYWDNALGEAYSNAPHYRETAAAAILEMRRQTGNDVLDENGLMKKGLILRHLVLPGHYRDSFQVLDWIKDALGTETFVSLMSQYTPMHRAREYKNLSRRLTTFEYDKVVAHFFEIGLKNGFMQKRSAATSEYTPVFDLSGVSGAEGFIKREEN